MKLHLRRSLFGNYTALLHCFEGDTQVRYKQVEITTNPTVWTTDLTQKVTNVETNRYVKCFKEKSKYIQNFG